MYRQSSSSKISANDLMNEIHDSIQKKVECFIDGLSNNSTLDIIEKLPVVEELRKILNEKEQIISILLEENSALLSTICSKYINKSFCVLLKLVNATKLSNIPDHKINKLFRNFRAFSAT